MSQAAAKQTDEQTITIDISKQSEGWQYRIGNASTKTPIAQSKRYRSSASAVRSLQAVYRRLSSRKVSQSVAGFWGFSIASENGTIVLESVAFGNEAEAEHAAGELQKFFDAGHLVTKGGEPFPTWNDNPRTKRAR